MSTPTSDAVARRADAAGRPLRPLPTDRWALVREVAVTRRDWRRARASGAPAARVAAAWFAAVRARADALTPVRAWHQMVLTRGGIFAAGISYFAMFSTFAALAVAVTVVGFVLRGNEPFRQAAVRGLDAVLPGLLSDAPGGDGVVDLGSLVQSRALTVTGVVGLVVLLSTALGGLGAMREGIRAVFGLDRIVGNVLVAKLRDLATLVVFGVAVVLSGASGLVAGAAGRWLPAQLGGAGSGAAGVLTTVLGVVLGVLVDTTACVLVLRVLAGLRLPARILWQSGLITGIGLGVLKLLGGRLLTGVTSDPLLASFAVPAGLLLWFNLMARVVLASAAWASIMWTELHHDRVLGREPDPPAGRNR